MDARPGAQERALEKVLALHHNGGLEYLADIGAAGAIPAVEQLLGPGMAANVQGMAGPALKFLK
ncbi:hypothetical protein FOA52_004995 [Chlamydomonas sp. UWO 241]|nr:hypothetical protein FOA52_004995 [Chlamydomonas sp. UWO 241]